MAWSERDSRIQKIALFSLWSIILVGIPLSVTLTPWFFLPTWVGVLICAIKQPKEEITELFKAITGKHWLTLARMPENPLECLPCTPYRKVSPLQIAVKFPEEGEPRYYNINESNESGLNAISYWDALQIYRGLHPELTEVSPQN